MWDDHSERYDHRHRDRQRKMFEKLDVFCSYLKQHWSQLELNKDRRAVYQVCSMMTVSSVRKLFDI